MLIAILQMSAQSEPDIKCMGPFSHKYIATVQSVAHAVVSEFDYLCCDE